MKKGISYLITVMMVFTMVPYVAFADNVNDQAARENKTSEGAITSDVVINSIYKDLLDDANLAICDGIDGSDIQPNQGSEDDINYESDVEDAAEVIREQMKNRDPNPVTYLQLINAGTKDIKAASSEIFYTAMEHTGVPTEGDYLGFTWNSMKCHMDYFIIGNMTYVTYQYDIGYNTNASQEAKVDAAVTKLKNDLHISDENDYEKIKAIYDYMTSNIKYDYENLNDDSNKLKHTAYAALIDKKAVCQGYAILFYRLALEYGVDVRIIKGKSYGENHAWNIVELNDKYYNLDSTWDAGNSEYYYFLKGSDSFTNHSCDSEYTEASFTSKYSIDKKDYEVVETEPTLCDELGHDYKTVVTKPTCTEKGFTTYTCKRDAKHTYTGDFVDPIGHKYGSYKTTTKAKFGKNGVQTATCAACSDKVTKPIAAPKTIKLSYTSYTYNGKSKKPTVKAVYDSAGNKISPTNYKVSYAYGRKNVGKYKVTVTFNKNSADYTESNYTTFKINPKGTSISSLAKIKRGFTVKWKKQSGKMATSRITGYQYRYSTSSKMTNAKTITVKGYSKTSAKKTSLKAKKTYYIQVRTYKTVSGVKYYSGWSKTKSVKTK